MRRGHAALGLAALAAFVACSEDGATSAELEIDQLLTVAALVGGDVSIVVAQRDCELEGPAIVTAGGVELARVDTPQSLLIAGLDDDRLRFQLSIPSASLDPSRFGLPVQAQIEVSARCGGKEVRTEPYALTYVPTHASTLPPVTPRRFWASDTIGELLVCSGTKLLRVGFDAQVAQELELGFPCVEGELRGTFGSRRYLFAEDAGIAAIDPGPQVTWTRELRFQQAWVDDARDPIIEYEDGAGAKRVMVLDRATGLDVTAALTLANPPRGALSRNDAGDVLVLTSRRNVAAPSLTYYLERFTAAGAPIEVLEVVSYAWDAPSYIAEFSYFGDVLFYTAAPTAESERHIERLEIATGERAALTSSADPWAFALGEAYGRLLVASDDDFMWIDPATGVPLSEAFAPDSGNAFSRLRVEVDGSIIMLGDPTSQLASGLYVFAPDGSDVMRFHSGGTVFRWLAEDWTGGSLLGYFDEVHALPTRAEYDAMLGR